MSEKYVAEYVEIIDDHGERKGVCVTDTEHTVSFEVKDEIAAMELCDLLNEQQEKITELEIELTDCKNRKEQSEYNLRRENELLKKDNQRQKTLRNKHWREIQARANAYNRIISSLEDIIPQPMIEELRNAPLLACDYDGVESNE